MKKSKLLLFNVLIFSSMLGVGYASWNDSLASDTVVSTGNFNIDIIENQDPEVFLEDTDMLVNSLYNVATTSVIDNTSNKSIFFEISNFAPGSYISESFTFKNTGSIPAKLKSIDILLDNATSDTLERNIDEDFQLLCDAIDVQIIIHDEDNQELLNKYISLMEFKRNINDYIGLEIHPMETNTVTLNFILPIESLKDSQGQNTSMGVSLNFNFVQSNLF